jgi:hypothetical protein
MCMVIPMKISNKSNTNIIGFLSLLGLIMWSLSSMAYAQHTEQVGKQTVATFESSFVGSYRQGSVDVMSELVLFKDNTFCYSVAAGALDQMMTGRWAALRAAKESADLRGIYLTEIRPSNAPTYPVVGSHLKRANNKIEIVFDGRSLSEAYSPVFAVSNSEVLPETFKPLFSDNMDSWAESYFYPQIQPDQAKYLYIGDMPVDANGRPQKLQVVQYKLDSKFDTYRVYFDMATARPALNLTAKFTDGVLVVNGQRWGVKKVQPQKWMDEAKATCSTAAGIASSPDSEGGKSEGAKSEEVKQALLNLAVPLKTYQLDKKVIAGQAIFDKTYDSSKHAYDSDEEAVKEEKDALTAAFGKAMGEASGEVTKVDQFLSLTKNIVEANARVKQHALQLTDAYAQLINTMSGRRDFQSSTKVFFHFVNHILSPVSARIDALGSDDKEQVQYRISVIASQSLTAAIATKNTVMSQMVFDKVLTPKFDITTHKNATLIYNLACFYALNHKKTEMLEAVKQARKRGKPVKQFMDDTDFKGYLSDADFQAALK